MKQLTNIVDDIDFTSRYGNEAELREYLRALSLDGFESIASGREGALSRGLSLGRHLLFYADFVDFFRGREERVLQKFGFRAVAEAYYGARTPEELALLFRRDMDEAERLGVEYAVFHVSDVSIEECYHRRFSHSDEEVADAAAELINLAMKGRHYSFALLLENLPWPGLTFLRPDIPGRLLSRIKYENTGFMLDLGHLLCTNPSLRFAGEADAYLNYILDCNRESLPLIRGVHLHGALTGAYSKRVAEEVHLPEGDYFTRFAAGYRHVLLTDTHRPYLTSGIGHIIERISPDYLVYELAEPDPKKKAELIRAQQQALIIPK